MILKQKRIAKAISAANLANALRTVDARRSEKFKTIEGIQKIIQGAPDVAKAFFLQDTVFDDPAQSLSTDGTSSNPEVWSGFREGWDQASNAAGAFYFSNLRVANRIWELIDDITVANSATKNWSVLGEDSALLESEGAVRPTLTWGDLVDNQMTTWEDLPIAIDNRSWKEIQVSNYRATYGVSIDLSNSNPETAVTYTDDAIGMTPGSSDWYKANIFKDIKPCLFKDGKVVGYLNPNNFAEFEDGTAADITSGENGDVMIEIPKIGYKIATSGNTLTVQITNNVDMEGFHYYAHTRETEGDRNHLYISAYLGYTLDGKLRSLSGKPPTASQTIGTFRTQAKANGAGYDLLAFYPLTLLQCLYLIIYKNLNSQTALGMGCVNASLTNTGGTNTSGMDYGSSDTRQQMKFLGIEDFWGNLYYWIDGLFCHPVNGIIATAFNNFNDIADGYTYRGGNMATSDISGYLKVPQGTTARGFIIKESGGSNSTYFCDRARLHFGGLANFGGYWGTIANAGAFRLDVSFHASTAGSSVGGRLMYL